MDLNSIVSELKREQERIGKAINALLEGAGLKKPAGRPARKTAAPKRRGGITPAGRKRLAAAMKARWAARRVKGSAASSKATPVAKAATPKKRGGGLSAAGRKRLSEAMKKRWAERRKPVS